MSPQGDQRSQPERRPLAGRLGDADGAESWRVSADADQPADKGEGALDEEGDLVDALCDRAHNAGVFDREDGVSPRPMPIW